VVAKEVLHSIVLEHYRDDERVVETWNEAFRSWHETYKLGPVSWIAEQACIPPPKDLHIGSEDGGCGDASAHSLPTSPLDHQPLPDL
jgi:hypothetical protein